MVLATPPKILPSERSAREIEDEIATLANTLRIYDVGLLAKLACGQLLNNTDMERLNEHLVYEKQILAKHEQRLRTRGLLQK